VKKKRVFDGPYDPSRFNPRKNRKYYKYNGIRDANAIRNARDAAWNTAIETALRECEYRRTEGSARLIYFCPNNRGWYIWARNRGFPRKIGLKAYTCRIRDIASVPDGKESAFAVELCIALRNCGAEVYWS
jgi:hypothetical protein